MDEDIKRENDELRKAKVFRYYKPIAHRAVEAAVRYAHEPAPEPPKQMTSSSIYNWIMQRQCQQGG